MLAEVRAVGREEEHRAIQRAAVALDDADDEVDAVRPRGAREPIDGRSGHVHAALPVPPKVFTALVGARADDGAEVESARVGGHERFGEEDELGALLRGFTGQSVQLLDRPLAIERDGRRLDDGNLAC